MSTLQAKSETPETAAPDKTARLSAVEAAPAAGPAALSVLTLQRTAGNRAVAGRLAAQRRLPFVPSSPVVQRQETPKQRATAASESGKPELVADLDDEALRAASNDQRLKMIDILNGGGSGFQRTKLPRIWDAFGGDIKAVADANEPRWKQSFAVAGSSMRGSYNVMGQRVMFHRDVVSVASTYLDMNDRYCLGQFERLGLTDSGDVKVGPPTEDQSAALKGTRDDAAKLAAEQEALKDLRNIVVGYHWVESPPGGTGPPVAVGGHATFDPERPPGHGPLETDPKMKTWEEVKKAYDKLDLLIRARIMVNPTLFPLALAAHTSREDPTRAKSVSTGDDATALKTIGDGLKEVRANIAKTRPMLNVLAPDLEPIHGQLIAGTQQGAPDRNWRSSPFYAGIAADMIEERKPGPWWQTIGLAAAEVGAYLVAGLATGGTAIAIGLAAKGAASVALAEGKAQAMQAAYGATATEETALISQGQVDAAQAEVIVAAAFALLDTAFAVGAVRRALREVLQFEKVAAESATKAAAAADKWMLKEMTKDAEKAAMGEAKLALLRVQAEADAAAKALAAAKVAATTAAPEESARVAQAVQRAEVAAAKARTAAEETAAVAAGKRVVRAPAIADPGGLGSKSAYDATVRAAQKEIGSAWAAMTATEREAKAISVVTDRMRAHGLPDFARVVHAPGSGGASASWSKWELTVDPALFSGSHTLEQAVGIIYHEAAHFEDFIRVVRLKLGEGMLPSQISTLTGIENRGIQAAVKQGPLLPQTAEHARTQAIFESIWGTGRNYREAVYRNLDGSRQLLQNAESDIFTVIDKQTKKLLTGKTQADLDRAVANYEMHANQHWLNVNAYEQLPEEVRAFGVQEGLTLTFERAAFRQQVLTVAAAIALLAAGAAGSIKALADK